MLFCRRCKQCSRYRRCLVARRGELQQATAGGPLTKIHVNFTGSHVRSHNSFIYLLAAVDYFTKYLICVPIRDKSAFAKALVKHVYLLFGCPILQISHMGGEFQNYVMRNIADLLRIELNRSTAYRPSSNGAVESIHRRINAIFAKMVDENQRSWCELTPYVTFAYNTSYYLSTTFSPFYLLYLREARIPIDLVMENVGEAVPAVLDDYVTETRNRIEQAFKTLVVNKYQLGQALQRAKEACDGRIKKLQFKVDDLVWFFCPRKRPRLGPKWQLLTTGLGKSRRFLTPSTT